MSSKIENALDCMKTRRAALHSEKNEMSGHSSTQPSLSHRLMQLKRLQVWPVLDPSSINAIQTSGSGCFHRASYTFVWIIGGPQREISRDAERERDSWTTPKFQTASGFNEGHSSNSWRFKIFALTSRAARLSIYIQLCAPSSLQLWQLQIRIVSDIWFEINTI